MHLTRLLITTSLLLLCVDMVVWAKSACFGVPNYASSSYGGQYASTDFSRGLPGGGETQLPLVDIPFLIQVEGNLGESYVPQDTTTCKVLGHSGVTFCNGIDVGQWSKDKLRRIGVSRGVLSKIPDSFFGARGNAALAALRGSGTVVLSERECRELNTRVIDHIASQVASEFTAAAQREGTNKVTSFARLPRGIRTAIYSVYHQYGSTSKIRRFWKHVTSGNYDHALSELINFGDNYPTRRKKEAAIFAAALRNWPNTGGTISPDGSVHMYP